MRTRVGYTGGATPNPTYHHLGDHTETLQLDYDPARLSYERLLEIFWQSHDPFAVRWSRQYMAAVFYGDEEQRRLAKRSKARLEETLGREVTTPVLRLERFWLAEDYHQKYRLRGERHLMAEFAEMYPDERAFMDSTAAARVNGLLDGCPASEHLRELLPSLGLSREGGTRLLELVERRRGLWRSTGGR